MQKSESKIYLHFNTDLVKGEKWHQQRKDENKAIEKMGEESNRKSQQVLP